MLRLGLVSLVRRPRLEGNSMTSSLPVQVETSTTAGLDCPTRPFHCEAVVAAQFVTLRTVRMQDPLQASLVVDAARYGFQVVGVNAMADSTKMIQHFPHRDGANVSLIGNAMGQATAAVPTVAIGVDVSCPQPACFSLVDVRLEGKYIVRHGATIAQRPTVA